MAYVSWRLDADDVRGRILLLFESHQVFVGQSRSKLTYIQHELCPEVTKYQVDGTPK